MNSRTDGELSCEDRMTARAARVKRMCEFMTQDGSEFKDALLESNVKVGSSVYLNKRRRAMVCAPHKCASQTWRYFFLKLNQKGKNHK